ncbi:MAG: SAM-dependent methyltransferase [Actinomycetota bacterium]|nr:MAG: SAM-dependent methyltransferase [Actinomycetota bacterium]
MSAPFGPGDRALLLDQRGRRYLVRLQSGGTFHSHAGTLAHDELLGRSEGTAVETTGGMRLVAFRPRLADDVLKMPRGAQVIYPKDLGPILIEADVFPGARVLEAGTGSGALTIALARAIGPTGRLVSYEVRDEHRERAAANVAAVLGAIPPQLELRAGDLRDVAATGERFDRCLLDVPEPWTVLDAVAAALEPGGVLGSYLPTAGQVQHLVGALPEAGFWHLETSETLRRSWHVGARSVRPEHRMVGHTGFLTIARRLG